MQISEYKNIFENEATHFYYVGYRKIIFSFIKKIFKGNRTKKIRILDAGSGTGIVAQQLSQFGKVEAIDISNEAVKFAKKRGVNIKKGSIVNLPFKENTFDLTLSLDVIYHQAVDSDQQALAELWRVLKPQGILILKVPAFNFLKGNHDLLVHTRKRYNIYELKRECKKAGFSIIKATFIASFLFLPAIINRLAEKLQGKSPNSNVKKIRPLFNNLLIYLFKLEDLLLQFIDLPLGITILVIAQKGVKGEDRGIDYDGN